MKLLWFLFVFETYVGAFGPPKDQLFKSFPEDNSLYKVTRGGGAAGGSQYIWLPTDEGQVLVDLKEDMTESLMHNSRASVWNTYYLYTARNRAKPVVISFGDVTAARGCKYDRNFPTAVLVHDWRSNSSSYAMKIINRALTFHKCNVIALDWQRIAEKPYTQAVWSVPEIGKHVGDFVAWFYDVLGGRWNRTHFIGYGMGAHIVGNAGRSLGGRVARITGLDPTGPLFGEYNNDGLRKHDARHVEVFHTNFMVFGSTGLRGHVDFFPNGGQNQPLCVGEKKHSCNHLKSCEYFQASVRGTKIIGRKCQNLDQAFHNKCSGSVVYIGTNHFPKKGSGIYGAKVEFRFD